MASRWLTMVLLIALVGCGEPSPEGATDTTAGPATTATAPGTTIPSTTAPTTAPATVTTVTTPSTTTITTSAPSGLVLRTDGLGVVSFGEAAEDVMAVLTDILGPADWEEVQIGADTDLSVSWGDDGAEFLYLQFTYWDYFDEVLEPPQPMPPGPVFHYYLTRSGLLATEAGIAVGSTVADLESAYPEVRFTSSCADDAVREFVVDPPEGWLHLPIWGYLDGDPTDKATRVEYIGAGWDRSPC